VPTYNVAGDIKTTVDCIIESLELFHIDKSRVFCLRSKGTNTSGTLARIHSFPKIYQVALGMKPIYIIELISEKYDRLSESEKEKILIHELLHIPKGFSGGLTCHRKGFEKTVELLHRTYKSKLMSGEKSH